MRYFPAADNQINHNLKRTSPVLKQRFQGASGVSLIEVMLIMLLMASTVMPYMVMVNQLRQTAKSGFVQSSRSLLVNSRLAETSPQIPTFQTTFNDGSNQTVQESGDNIPTLRKADATNSNIFQRQSYLYLYNTAGSSVLAKTLSFQNTDVYRLAVNKTQNTVDNADNYWATDFGTTLYNSGNRIPAPLAGMSPTGSTSGLISSTCLGWPANRSAMPNSCSSV